MFDPFDAVVGTTTTDDGGNYEFTDLPKGTYVIVEKNLPGYKDVSVVDGFNNNKMVVDLDAGEVVTGRDFVDAQRDGDEPPVMLQEGATKGKGHPATGGIATLHADARADAMHSGSAKEGPAEDEQMDDTEDADTAKKEAFASMVNQEEEEEETEDENGD